LCEDYHLHSSRRRLSLHDVYSPAILFFLSVIFPVKDQVTRFGPNA
jgi:hypothetical protein